MTGSAAILVIALLLDAAFGEPKMLWSRWPHPAVRMGRFIAWLDQGWNSGQNKKAKGIAAVAVLILVGWVIGNIVSSLPLSGLWEVLICAILLAQKSLCDHVSAVARDLRLGLAAGRHRVAQIVGRDTAAMGEPDVARAAIESAAENLSDGVVAPAFWFLLGGLPGVLIYKLINTADSMIGYRTPRHAEFGWAAARLDDVLNWIPARLTAFLILLLHGRLSEWARVRRDAALHRSPNAGWPETAMAVSLNVALAGPRSYDGQMRDFPFVYPEGKHDIGAPEVDASTRALWQTWGGLVALCLLLIPFS